MWASYLDLTQDYMNWQPEGPREMTGSYHGDASLSRYTDCQSARN